MSLIFEGGNHTLRYLNALIQLIKFEQLLIPNKIYKGDVCYKVIYNLMREYIFIFRNKMCVACLLCRNLKTGHFRWFNVSR